MDARTDTSACVKPSLAAFFTLVCPERFVFAFHTFDELFGRYVVVNLVGVGYEQRHDIVFVKTFMVLHSVLNEASLELFGLHGEVAGDLFGEVVNEANVIERNAHGFLFTRFKNTHELEIGHVLPQNIPAGFYGFVTAHKAGHKAERKQIIYIVTFAQTLLNIFKSGSSGTIRTLASASMPTSTLGVYTI